MTLPIRTSIEAKPVHRDKPAQAPHDAVDAPVLPEGTNSPAIALQHRLNGHFHREEVEIAPWPIAARIVIAMVGLLISWGIVVGLASFF